jgi:hypothetical protein
MKKMDVVEVCSRDNEIHLVFKEGKNDKRLRERDGFSPTEVKKIMKKEAAKLGCCFLFFIVSCFCKVQSSLCHT